VSSPAWTLKGFSRRKTVCFQCVFVTRGLVENITWSYGKRKREKEHKHHKLVLLTATKQL